MVLPCLSMDEQETDTLWRHPKNRDTSASAIAETD